MGLDAYVKNVPIMYQNAYLSQTKYETKGVVMIIIQ